MKLGSRSTKVISKLPEMRSWQSRGLYGITALCTQPFLDARNRHVDKKTQDYSFIRTSVKVVVGASVGILTRAPFDYLGQYLVEKKQWLKVPDAIKKLPDGEKRFAKGVGVVLSLVPVVMTMFTIDVPISNFALNRFLPDEKSNSKEKYNELA